MGKQALLWSASISFRGTPLPVQPQPAHRSPHKLHRALSAQHSGGRPEPNIVFEVANAADAAVSVIVGIFAAASQTCIAGSRVVAHRSVYHELVERVTERASTIIIGEPLEDKTELGPLAFKSQLEKVESYVGIGVDEGAILRFGGKRPDVGLPGYFFETTVRTETNNDMRVCQEEIFGAVAAIMLFGSEGEVLRLANDTEYGLASGVWALSTGWNPSMNTPA